MELSSQDSLTHRISNILARTTSLIRIKWFLFLIERAFIWAKVTWRSWLESECLTGPGWGWTSPLRTKVTSTGLKDAVWLVKYATLALKNFLRVRGAKWPSARSGTGSRSRLNSFEFDLNSSQNYQGYEEKLALCCGSASSKKNSRGTEKHRRNADDIKTRPTAMTADSCGEMQSFRGYGEIKRGGKRGSKNLPIFPSKHYIKFQINCTL